MSNREFNEKRTGLANEFAAAGQELLSYMGTAAALAAIPSTEPPRYVVAGTLADIVKLLPAAEVIRPAKGITSLEGLTRYMYTFNDGMEVDNACGRYYLVDEVDSLVESLLATQAAPASPEQVTEGIASDVLQRVRDLLEGAAAWSAGDETRKRIHAALYLLAAPSAAAPAAADFAAWLAREMPTGTVIGDPAWWAPRIAHACLAAHKAAPAAPEQNDSSMPIDMAQAKGWITQLRARVDSLLTIINADKAAAPAAEEVRNQALEDVVTFLTMQEGWSESERKIIGICVKLIFVLKANPDLVPAPAMKRAARTEGDA